MISSIPNYREFYEVLQQKFKDELEEKGIGILSDFLENGENMSAFHQKYVLGNKPKIVICGINPGRFGAGKTGVPFLDFNSLSKLLPNIERRDSEKSSKFFYSIIEEFGAEHFYKNFYITNLSQFGFYNLKSHKNVNYNELPQHIQIFILEKFVEEMNVINPRIIVPLGNIVNWELTLNLKKTGKIKAEIAEMLYHPSYLRANKQEYFDALKKHLITAQ